MLTSSETPEKNAYRDLSPALRADGAVPAAADWLARLPRDRDGIAVLMDRVRLGMDHAQAIAGARMLATAYLTLALHAKPAAAALLQRASDSFDGMADACAIFAFGHRIPPTLH